MAEKKVCIEVDDNGQILVGLEPAEMEQMQGGMQQGGEEQSEQSYMKPVKSIDDALSVARDLLTGDTGEQAQQANEQSFQQGFQGRQPMGPAKMGM